MVQIHWGGGTPSYLTPEQIADLMEHTRAVFRVSPTAEISLEADPRDLTADRIAGAAAAGFNRISYGVQDVDPVVHEAIHRVQPTHLVEQAVRWARDHGFQSINLDLVYGLPHQSAQTFEQTIDTVFRLDPDRVALFSYAHVPSMNAHVPSMKKHQRLIDTDALPAPDEKLRTFKMATERLTGDGGYRFIGMDPFARPDDELRFALDDGTLHRNVHGDSTCAGADVVAFGVSGISQLDGAYVQNLKGPAYYDRIDVGELAIYRGVQVSGEDRLRRHVIMAVMYHGGDVQRARPEARRRRPIRHRVRCAFCRRTPYSRTHGRGRLRSLHRRRDHGRPVRTPFHPERGDGVRRLPWRLQGPQSTPKRCRAFNFRMSIERLKRSGTSLYTASRSRRSQMMESF